MVGDMSKIHYETKDEHIAALRKRCRELQKENLELKQKLDLAMTCSTKAWVNGQWQ